MATTGIKVDDDCVEFFENLRTTKAFQFLEFTVIGDEHISLTNKGERGVKFADFVKTIPEDTPHYYVFDYDYKNEEGDDRNNLLFINWCPDKAKPRVRMVHSGSKDSLKKKLQRTGREIQANDKGDLDEATVIGKLPKA
eukprot:NODE_6138_length_568_cov_105.179138_g5973_i0.p1 GENE.NODE_6138_length_568_cov_105.179138_g5973_i0~~NODE_6138_length_568_cov_105.179138_g5973_i0.p1  ORF type:complete len:161 (-),score=44.85 NODE_6138_length_568_cov_105.179138_g5973_i0:86-502(-)